MNNIWIAASDEPRRKPLQVARPSFLDSCQHTTSLAVSPNAPDPFTYTPMHAAASYGRGNVNITDSDGDTPLYTVESVEIARYLVEKGAVVDRVNAEGISPIAHLSEDFPEVAAFLQTQSSLPPSSENTPSTSQQSQYAQNAATEQLTTSLLSQVQSLVDQGMDPDQAEEELRRLVSQAVVQGLVGGYTMAVDAESSTNEGDGSGQRRQAPSEDTKGDEINKRAKRDE
ncbi:hypothetical protein D9758_003672 [Tetrapyrgos nigripes]|uniref:Ankyrin n=1 Tax=Tetrapyrgos nigripes TaxID=182062 RepID=A0A8H5GLS7_9AGAR|nr:hypothetical protein D9758_003672 [Tetrapyrgos nigripes]